MGLYTAYSDLESISLLFTALNADRNISFTHSSLRYLVIMEVIKFKTRIIHNIHSLNLKLRVVAFLRF